MFWMRLYVVRVGVVWYAYIAFDDSILLHAGFFLCVQFSWIHFLVFSVCVCVCFLVSMVSIFAAVCLSRKPKNNCVAPYVCVYVCWLRIFDLYTHFLLLLASYKWAIKYILNVRQVFRWRCIANTYLSFAIAINITRFWR